MVSTGVSAFALSELRANYKDYWVILTPAHRNKGNRVDVWDLVFASKKKSVVKSQLKKLREKSGLQNAVLYWTKACQCNIKLVGKNDEDVWLPNEVAEFFRAYYGFEV